MSLHYAAVFVCVLTARTAAAQTLPAIPLYGDDTVRYDNFGTAAVFLGERLVIGARGDALADCTGCGTGSVYVFDYAPAEADRWAQTAHLTSSQTYFDYFLNGGRLLGSQVAACESEGPEGSVGFIAAGAPLESYGQDPIAPVRDSVHLGAVYVYRQPAGEAWTLDHKLQYATPGRPLFSDRNAYTGSSVGAVCENRPVAR